MAVNAANLNSGARLIIKNARSVAILLKMAVRTVHSFFEVDVLQMHGFSEFVRVVGRDDLVIRIEQIATRVLLTREPGSALYTTVSRLFGEDPLMSVETILLGETEAIKRSVELGLGVALIQKIAIEREVQQGTLRTIALKGVDNARTYLIAVRKRYTPNDAAIAFIDLLPLQ